MKDMGIEILEKQERNLSEEEAREFYSHVEGEVYNHYHTILHLYYFLQFVISTYVNLTTTIPSPSLFNRNQHTHYILITL